MKILWFVTPKEGKEFSFTTLGTPPALHSQVYINHYDKLGKLKCFVERVDHSVNLYNRTISSFDLKSSGPNERFDEMMKAVEDDHGYLYELDINDKSVYCSHHEVQVIVRET